MIKAASILFIATLGVGAVATVTAAASGMQGEPAAPAQPFAHPSDDVSYSKDLQEDEMRAKGEPANNGDVQYISGGIGSSGMNAIKEEEKAYNLKMLFVAGGEYLANVGVHIKDSKGNEVLDATTEGPVLLVKMRPGSYTVEATKAPDGATITQHVKVGSDNLASYVLRYPVGE